MRILLSNDDGILAPGIAALYDVVHDVGEVDVVAPDSPQSAAGHSITIRHPLHVRRVEVDSSVGFTGRSVTGSPADSVRLAVFELLEERPELVLSGINEGANVGIHVFYSGTVAAAAEAAMFGIPAVAFSTEYIEGVETDFARAAGFCREVLQTLLSRGLRRGDLINVNVPSLSRGEPKGLRVVNQATVEMRDNYEKVESSHGQDTYEIRFYDWVERQRDTDLAAVAEGYVTVTPLHIDMTRHDQLPELESLDWSGVCGG
jgi:5'-nucleotidase